MDEDILVITEKYREHFTISFNLYEVFFGREEDKPDPTYPIVRYTRWGRIKKITKLLKQYQYDNEEAMENYKSWIRRKIEFYTEVIKDKKKVELLEKALKEVG